MNELIISPWVIYFMEVLDNLGWALLAVFAVSIFYTLAKCIDYNHSYDDSQKEKNMKLVRIGLIVVIVNSLLLIFMPSNTTMLAMYVANNATKQSLVNGHEFVKEEIKGSIDYIFEKIDKRREK